MNILKQFGLATVSSWVATALDFGLTALLASGLGVWYVAATTIGAVAGGVFNCAVNYRWVFHRPGLDPRTVAVRYALVWMGSILLNTGGTCLLTEWGHLPYIISKAITAILIACCWNFLLQRHYVYRP